MFEKILVYICNLYPSDLMGGWKVFLKKGQKNRTRVLYMAEQKPSLEDWTTVSAHCVAF